MPTVLLGAEPIRHQPGPFRTLLENAGFRVVAPLTTSRLTDADLLEWLPRCDSIIAGGETISGPIIAASPNLRAIARTGVGYDAVDVAAATSRQIAVTITPGANQDAVAEQTFALLLALVKDVVKHDRSIRSGVWDRSPLPRPIRGRTMGIVGMGRIGRAVATRSVAFGMRVVAFEPTPDPEFDARYGIARGRLRRTPGRLGRGQPAPPAARGHSRPVQPIDVRQDETGLDPAQHGQGRPDRRARPVRRPQVGAPGRGRPRRLRP